MTNNERLRLMGHRLHDLFRKLTCSRRNGLTDSLWESWLFQATDDTLLSTAKRGAIDIISGNQRAVAQGVSWLLRYLVREACEAERIATLEMVLEAMFGSDAATPTNAAMLEPLANNPDLSIRTRKCLIFRLKLATVGELTQLTADDLLSTKNFGVTCLAEVRQFLARRGLWLREDGPSAGRGGEVVRGEVIQ